MRSGLPLAVLLCCVSGVRAGGLLDPVDPEKYPAEIVPIDDRSVVGWLAFGPDDSELIIGIRGQPPRVWDRKKESMRTDLPDLPEIKRLVFSPDGKTALTSEKSGAVLRDARSWKTLRSLDARSWPERLRFSSDGSRIVAQWPAEVAVWDAASGVKLDDFDTYRDNVVIHDVAFSAGGVELLAITGVIQHGTRLKRWRIGGHWPFARSKDALIDERASMDAWFSPDGKTALIRYHQGGPELVDLSSFQRKTLPVGDSFEDASFSRDGSKLALSGTFADAGTIWDVAGAKPLGALEGFSVTMNFACFSADGRSVAAANGGMAHITGTPVSARVWSESRGRWRPSPSPASVARMEEAKKRVIEELEKTLAERQLVAPADKAPRMSAEERFKL